MLRCCEGPEDESEVRNLPSRSVTGLNTAQPWHRPFDFAHWFNVKHGVAWPPAANSSTLDFEQMTLLTLHSAVLLTSRPVIRSQIAFVASLQGSALRVCAMTGMQ